MQQITNEAGLIEKRITRIERAGMGQNLVLFFGERYAVYEATILYDDCPEIEFRPDELHISEQVALGIITREEYGKLLARRTERDLAESKQMRRAQYERLRAEFGDEGEK